MNGPSEEKGGKGGMTNTPCGGGEPALTDKRELFDVTERRKC